MLSIQTYVLESGDCKDGANECQEICIRVPGGFNCACSLGKKLGEDRKSCIDGNINTFIHRTNAYYILIIDICSTNDTASNLENL